MDLQLTGKRALVTGGSRGIGRAIARSLATEGVEVVLTARNPAALETAAAALASETGGRVLAVAGDVGDDASVRSIVDRAAQALGGLDILINNAATPGGAGPAALLDEIESANLLADVNVKVAGYLRVARAVAPYQVAGSWGRIINIGGLAARRTGHYVASIRNSAVSALTKNLADELGPRGITSNALHPGATRTERTTPDDEVRIAAANTTARVVDAADIGWFAAVLASPLSTAINGETIAIGGGTPGVINY